MEKSSYVVWSAPSSKFLKMARSPKSLATPGLNISQSSLYRSPLKTWIIIFFSFLYILV